MNWSDDALILGVRKFGEGGLILDVLTATRGRQSGLVYGGASRKRRAHYEPGNTLAVAWRGRLEDQLGRFDVAEPTRERATRLLENANALMVITVVTTLLREVLKDGDAAGSAMYEASMLVLDQLEHDTIWPGLYARWELGLLSALGYGLDIESCAISGANDGLSHVSPRTGRAVRGSEAGEYLDRLLRLPEFLYRSNAPLKPGDLKDGLALTGYFLEARIFHALNRPIPEVRTRLVARLSR